MSTQTVTVSDLRQDLDSIFKRVKNGQTFELTHRLYGSVFLSPAAAISTQPSRLTGLDALLAAKRKKSTLDPNKTWKEIYQEVGISKHSKTYGFPRR
jgi:antitoxin (DNA-binding transcriptional repressor) of toxin-antitoxin stability system